MTITCILKQPSMENILETTKTECRTSKNVQYYLYSKILLVILDAGSNSTLKSKMPFHFIWIVSNQACFLGYQKNSIAIT